MRRKLLILFLLIALVTCGCAPKEKPKRSNHVDLVAWHWLADRTGAFDVLRREYESEKQAFNVLSKLYKEVTGVDVKFEFVIRFELYAPTAAYTSKIRAAAQANKLPEIYGVLMEMRDFASLIKAGHVLDVTPYMDENNGAWRSTFHKSGLLMNSFLEDNQYGVKPGIYGVPIDINNIQFVYNLDLLKKAGWDTTKIPSTWKDFLALGDALKKAGIPGLVSGWGESWMIHCMADNFAWNIMGKERILATIKGEVPYTDPSWVQVFDLFEQMKERGLLSEGIVTMVNKEAEQTFANERAAIAFNGSWGVNVYESMNPDLRYAVGLPPRVNMKNPAYIWGGTTSFVINAKSPLKEDAVKFLKWLTEERQERFLAENTRNIPAVKGCSDVLQGPAVEFANGMDNVVHPRLLPIEEYPLVTEAIDKGIQSIVIGEASPEEVAKTVQKTKEEETKKAQRFKELREKQSKGGESGIPKS